MGLKAKIVGSVVTLSGMSWGSYELLNDTESRAFLEEHLSPSVLGVVEKLTPSEKVEWVKENLFTADGIRKLAATGGTAAGVVASEAAKAANEGSFTGKFAFAEKLGEIWNKFFGEGSGLKFINFFRELMGLEPKQLTADGLKTVEEIVQESTPDMAVSDIPAADFKNELTRQMNAFADPVTGDIDYSTENLRAAAKKADPAFADELNGISKTAGLTGTQDLYKTFNELEGMTADNAMNFITDLRENVRTATPETKLDTDFIKQAM